MSYEPVDETERRLREKLATYEAMEAWTEEDEKSFRQREKALAKKARDHAPTEAEYDEQADLIALAIMRSAITAEEFPSTLQHMFDGYIPQRTHPLHIVPDDFRHITSDN